MARARGLLQREVGRGLRTRTIPRLVFVHDEGIANAIRINKLLQELNHGDKPAVIQPSGDQPAGDRPVGGQPTGGNPPPTAAS